MLVDVIIPALNEEPSVAKVVRDILQEPVRGVYVVDNGSRDQTAKVARDAGATVLSEPERGYGAACLTGIAALPADTDIVLFMDADGSDDPKDAAALIQPIEEDRAELVVGSRALGVTESGALSPQQRFGNAIASRWLSVRFGLPATDLGPFRAIRKDVLDRLGMVDRNYGWTVEMQIKAARQGVRYAETPVSYRRRIGKSKVSGTVRGVVGAGTKIIGLLAYYDLLGARR